MNANVDVEVLEKQIKLLNNSINQINRLCQNLSKDFQNMQDWNDSKSRDAKLIVANCGKELKKMQSEVKIAVEKLGQIIVPLREYENTNLRGSGSNTGGGSANTGGGSADTGGGSANTGGGGSNTSGSDTNIDSSIVGILINSIASRLSSDVRDWTNRLDSIAADLQTVINDKYGVYILPDKRNSKMQDSIVYDTQKLFDAIGMEPEVLGYNDGRRSHIAVGTGHELATTVHENYHQLSANGNYHGLINLSDGQNRQMNEAITELLTQRTLGDQYGPDYSLYSENRDAMAVLESAMGEDRVMRAYFQNRPDLMQNEFDRVLGPGSFEQLSEAFDDSLSDYEHTRDAGRIRRDNLINRYVSAHNSNGGGINWNILN